MHYIALHCIVLHDNSLKDILPCVVCVCLCVFCLLSSGAGVLCCILCFLCGACALGVTAGRALRPQQSPGRVRECWYVYMYPFWFVQFSLLLFSSAYYALCTDPTCLSNTYMNYLILPLSVCLSLSLAVSLSTGTAKQHHSLAWSLSVCSKNPSWRPSAARMESVSCEKRVWPSCEMHCSAAWQQPLRPSQRLLIPPILLCLTWNSPLKSAKYWTSCVRRCHSLHLHCASWLRPGGRPDWTAKLFFQQSWNCVCKVLVSVHQCGDSASETSARVGLLSGSHETPGGHWSGDHQAALCALHHWADLLPPRRQHVQTHDEFSAGGS